MNINQSMEKLTFTSNLIRNLFHWFPYENNVCNKSYTIVNNNCKYLLMLMLLFNLNQNIMNPSFFR